MDLKEYILRVDDEHAGIRLDRFVAESVSDLSRARAQTLIQSGSVRVNGNTIKPSHKVQSGDTVLVQVEPSEPSRFEAEDIPLDIVFEDEHIIVVNKPVGMIVHPAPRITSGTLVNALLAHVRRLPVSDSVERPGIVHRIDKNTSGLLVIARTERAQAALSRSIGRRKVKREYRALTYGRFTESEGTIDAPIGRSPSDRKKMAVTGIGSREATTHFAVREDFCDISHLTVRLETGRTHQIRVHMAYIGHPIVGDSVYGTRLKRFHETMPSAVADAISGLVGHMLHAETLAFKHPISGEPLHFSAPLPDEFERLLGLLCEKRRSEANTGP